MSDDRGGTYCKRCGEPKEYVDEPMVSGIRGYFCTNDDCSVDS